ncbi:MAG: EF-Tu/IF-2/RF-3 family GTPase [Candidatus Micrarchaeia archaeon]
MKGIIVALPNDENLAKELGKKGTANGINFFNRKAGDTTITVLTPSDIKEKYYAVAQSIMLANVVVLSSKSIDALFGEVVIASALLNKRILVTKEGDARKVLGEANADYEVVPREELLASISNIAAQQKPDSAASNGFKRIEIDKAFPVNGVGDVALGVVVSGSVAKHDVLLHNSGVQVTVRSVQMQDEDVEVAEEGARVGLALKGLSYEEIEKGDVLSSKQIKPQRKLLADISLSKFIKDDKIEGRWQLIRDFSAVNATITAESGKFAVSLEKAVPFEKGDRFLLVRGSVPRIAASGIVSSITDQ